MTEHEKDLNRQAYELLGYMPDGGVTLENPCAEMHARYLSTRPQRMIPADEVADWLASIGFGIDFGMGLVGEDNPPITAEELARAYMRMEPDDPDGTLEVWMETIAMETGFTGTA